MGTAETVGQVHKVFAVHFGLFKQLAGPREVLAVQGQILEDLFFKAVGILAVKLFAQRLALFQGDFLVADLLCSVIGGAADAVLDVPLLHRRGQGKPKTKQALAGVSITLGPGLYGLLGPNGAGKSTLIGIITGGLAADSGEVLWCGRPAHGIAFRRVLGYMPQQQGLYDSYTGRRFLAYMAALKEIPRAAVPGEVARVAAAVNLTDELDKRLAAYSGGMKQRLLLAAALLGDPKLLILDEPTAGLDPRERVRLRTLLADMAQDRIILVATHVVSDVESVATKVILLRAGKIVDAAPVPDLIEKHAPGGGLEDVYLNVFGEGDGK